MSLRNVPRAEGRYRTIRLWLNARRHRKAVGGRFLAIKTHSILRSVGERPLSLNDGISSSGCKLVRNWKIYKRSAPGRRKVWHGGVQDAEKHPFCVHGCAGCGRGFCTRWGGADYLNFSDPWPKARHEKRRLTSHEFLERYEQILVPGGTLEFKTDNTELFNFSLEQVKSSSWTLEHYTYDLHHHEIMNEGNVMTEYEEKFSARGNPINKLIAVRK